MAETKSNRGGHNFKDLTGQRFGKLTVIERGPNSTTNQTRWICLCDCGKTTNPIHGSALKNGLTLSCGCKHVDAGRERTIDMTGQKFGRLTVAAAAASSDTGRAMWSCLCDCGRTVIVKGKELRNGNNVSCGCWKRERLGDYARTHGMRGTPEYRSWKHAKERCFNPANKKYDDYGGRGIIMCMEWAQSFEAFYAHIGPRPPGTSLDRFPNNDGNYEPDNVRWATSSQQAYNRRPKRWRHRPQQ